MEIIKSEQPKARKPHRCMLCNGAIRIGEAYNRDTIAIEGCLRDTIYHRHCGELIEMLNMYDNNGHNEGITDIDFECNLYDYVSNHHNGDERWEGAKPFTLAKMIYEELNNKKK